MRWIIYSITITVTPHERHGEWEHQPHRFFPRHFLANNITSYLTVCSKTHSCCHQAFTLLTLCEGVSHRKIPSDTNVWIEFRVLTHLLIWRILCAVLERYFCNRIPLQITRWSFCYSVSDRYRAFISANPRWKCSFDVVLIAPNRHHRR